MKLWSRMPPRLRRHIVSATEQAGQRGDEAATTNDLLQSICHDDRSAAVFVLKNAGVSVKELLGRLSLPASNNRARFQRAQRLDGVLISLLERAALDADRLGSAHIGTEHVILAASESNSLPVSRMLHALGLTSEKAKAGIQRWIEEGVSGQRNDAETISASRPSKLPRFLKMLVKGPKALYAIFIRKSLGHPKFVHDPYPLYRWLREREPVRKDPLVPVWVLTRYADVATALKDPRFKKDPFATERLADEVRRQLGVELKGRSDVETVSMLFLDPPQHTRIRQQFVRAFTPRRIENLRQRVQKICDVRLAAVRGQPSVDLIESIASPLPVIVIAELLGFPRDRLSEIQSMVGRFRRSAGAECQARGARSGGEQSLSVARILRCARDSAQDRAGGQSDQRVFADGR